MSVGPIIKDTFKRLQKSEEVIPDLISKEVRGGGHSIPAACASS